MAHLNTLSEDLNKIGLEALETHLLGINSLTEAKSEAAEADTDTGTDTDTDVETGFSPEVVEAANAIYLHIRPQISEDAIDYDVEQFEGDLITAIANLVESEVESLEESERDFDAIKVQVSSVVAEAYNDLTIDDDDLDEDALEERKLSRAKRRTGPRGKSIQGVGRNVRVGAKGRKVKIRTAADLKQSKLGAMKRTAGVLKKKAKKGARYRKSGKGKQTMNRAARRKAMFASDVAAELAGLLTIAESTESTFEADPVRMALAEAFDRCNTVAAILGDFFESNGGDDDADIASVMDNVMESCETRINAIETLSEDEFDLKGQMSKLQAFAKVLARAEEEYAKYDLVDSDGNLIEMDDDTEEEEDAEGNE